jgi:hypothetical protein
MSGSCEQRIRANRGGVDRRRAEADGHRGSIGVLSFGHADAGGDREAAIGDITDYPCRCSLFSCSRGEDSTREISFEEAL